MRFSQKMRETHIKFEDKGNEKMKKMLLLGDSINLHYGPYLNDYLKDDFLIRSKPGRHEALRRIDFPVGGNGGDSSMVLSYLKELENEGKLDIDLFVFNCGLHDIKRAMPLENYQVKPEDYEKNLIEIFELAKKYQIETVFITTTPVDDERHNKVPPAGIKRYNEDVSAYNEIAVRIAKAYNALVIDLNTFTERLSGEKYIDHVHYIEEVRKLQASFVAGGLLTNFTKGKYN